VSPVEQDTIDCEYLVYLEPKKNQKKKIIKEILCNFIVRTLQNFRKNVNFFKNFASENMKKPPSKVAHNWPNFFSVLLTGPKPAQISFSVP
jgi:hypothetical protein